MCKPKWQKEYNFRCLGKLKNNPIKTDKYAKQVQIGRQSFQLPTPSGRVVYVRVQKVL